jgi:hypothetical protein
VSDIRAQLNRAAGPEEPPVDLDALHRRAHLRQQRRRAALTGLAAIVLLALGSFMWTSGAGGTADQQLTAGNGTDDTTGTSTLPNDTTVTTDPPTTETLPDTTTTTPAPSTTEPPTTTTAPVTTTTVPVTTTAVPPVATTLPVPDGTRHLSGTHRGEGLPFEPSRGNCDVLAHRLDSVFTLDTGENWNYHADYCGTLHGSLWTGAGTFTFTTPAGDTVTGTFTSRAVLPTKGEPYNLTVTNGTGPWAGASGTCHLTNHIRSLPSGLNEQAGDFTCDIQP